MILPECSEHTETPFAASISKMSFLPSNGIANPRYKGTPPPAVLLPKPASGLEFENQQIIEVGLGFSFWLHQAKKNLLRRSVFVFLCTKGEKIVNGLILFFFFYGSYVVVSSSFRCWVGARDLFFWDSCRIIYGISLRISAIGWIHWA